MHRLFLSSPLFQSNLAIRKSTVRKRALRSVSKKHPRVLHAARMLGRWFLYQFADRAQGIVGLTRIDRRVSRVGITYSATEWYGWSLYSRATVSTREYSSSNVSRAINMANRIEPCRCGQRLFLSRMHALPALEIRSNEISVWMFALRG